MQFLWVDSANRTFNRDKGNNEEGLLLKDLVFAELESGRHHTLAWAKLSDSKLLCEGIGYP